MKVLLKRFHLNGHTIGFRAQTQKLVTLQNSIKHSGSERVKGGGGGGFNRARGANLI